MTHKTIQERFDRWFGPAFQRGHDPRIVPTDASRAERQARTALRWYSPSWREDHGEELVGTVLDAAAAINTTPGQDRALPLRTRLDLARGGCIQRHRSRPTFRERSLLQSRMAPMTPQGLAWLRDRLDQRSWLVRRFALLIPLYMSPLVLMALYPGFYNPMHAGPVLAALFSIGYLALNTGWALLEARVHNLRRRAVKHAGLTETGWPVLWNPAPPLSIPASDPPHLGPPTTA